MALSGCNQSIGGGGGGPGKGPGEACATAEECAGTLVCDPQSETCADSVTCEEHGDCGAAAHCAQGGACEKSETGSPCGSAVNCSFDEECVGGFCGCDGLAFVADPVPANMLIVLDRSGSMQCHVNGTDDNVGPDDPSSRWQQALAAIDLLLESYGDRIRFGLAVFPNTNTSPPDSGAVCVGTPGCTDCTPGNTLVDVGEGTGPAITAALAGTAPGGCTPSGPALDDQLGYQPLTDPDTDNYVLFVTDGAEACSNPTQVSAITDLREQDPEVKTFVVGFTDQVNPTELNAAAEAGGTARQGATKYYQADDGASLQSAFAAIGGLALSCAFSLDEVPPNLEELYVYADGEEVPHDPTQSDGWDYDAATNQVTFYGSACETLRGGGVEDLVIVHGCPISID